MSDRIVYIISQLNSREIAIIRDCIQVFAARPYVRTDFNARVGANRDQVTAIGQKWPALSAHEPVTQYDEMVIHHVLNECTNGFLSSEAEWDRGFSFSRLEVRDAFTAWLSAIRIYNLNNAVKILRVGGVVAFPTETVYGLGADATNALAIARVFAIKGRPPTNPLIVHVANENIARRYAREFPVAATELVARFWPGPLTIVLKKSRLIVDAVTAGLDTVGLRSPDHPLALELLRAFDGALAGPSANRSNHVSPTTAQHVRDELGDAVDLILDGGPCKIGIESTVLSLVESVPKILRPGAITGTMIEAVIAQHVEQSHVVAEATTPPTGPGQFEKHYAPRTPAFRFEARDREKLDVSNAAILDLSLDPQTYARNFYARLRMLDRQDLRAIFIELPPDVEDWRAIRDRIIRATQPLG